jgi:DNA invertase Pin-like site-specific DNA recombinase
MWRRPPQEESKNGEAGSVALYARVSTCDQRSRRLDLHTYCSARAGDVVEFTDVSTSGMKDRQPGLDKLMVAVKARRSRRRCRGVRAGRSVRHLVETLETFRHLGVEFVSLREQIDTGSPLGQAVFTIIAAIAQLERSLIVERVKAGLRRAKADGRRLGRPPVDVDASALAQVVNAGLSVRAAALKLGVSPSTFRRMRATLIPSAKAS